MDGAARKIDISMLTFFNRRSPMAGMILMLSFFERRLPMAGAIFDRAFGIANERKLTPRERFPVNQLAAHLPRRSHRYQGLLSSFTYQTFPALTDTSQRQASTLVGAAFLLKRIQE